MSEVLAFDTYATNADLIVACRDLGYLSDEWTTLDPTYGEGVFWSKWKPKLLKASDLAPKAWFVRQVDFRKLSWPNRSFDAVVFDPPYKLNGTPDRQVDERYGVHIPTRWQDRIDLCVGGLRECARVYNGTGYLLMKCQDQVCSGKVRWQTTYFTSVATQEGLELVDRLDKLGGRKQPDGRRQVHARRNSSTMLVFKRAS